MDFRAAILVSRRVYKMSNNKLAFELSANGKSWLILGYNPTKLIIRKLLLQWTQGNGFTPNN